MSRPSRARVAAVLVAAAEVEHLRVTLAALAAQTAPPERVVVVRTDTGIDVAAILADVDLDAEVVDAAAATGFGDAVAAGVLAAAVDAPWLWLLHDDSAPEPGALAALTQVVETGRSIAIAGCKQVSWLHPERLVSVGVQYTPDIQRFTGIEDGEVDQGQHDDREDVESVGTAGMLVDREVFATLGGTDDALGPFGDGRDLSRRARLAGHRVVVVPRAVVRHARLSYFGQRRDPSRPPDRQHSLRQRRTSVLHSRLVEAPGVLVPLVAIAALLAAPVRSVGRLVSKELRLVGDELLAPLVALAGLGSIWRARRRARATRTGSTRRLRPLQASWRDVLEVRRDRRLQAAAQRRTVRAPSELEMRERSILGTRRRLVLGGVALVALAVTGLTVAPRAFSGPLIGGALLPVDVGFADLWRAATSGWLATGYGRGVPADPFTLVLGVLSALTGGPLGTPVWVTVSIVVVAAIPASALTAWFAAGAATRSLSLRAWGALVWALAPPLVLALAGGRLGAVVAHVMLPLVALALARAFGLDRRDVVVSGLVGARRVERRTASAPAVEIRRRRLAALAAVGDDAPTAQIARVLSGDETSTAEEKDEAGPPSAETPSAEPDEVDLTIPSNTSEPYDVDEEDELATIVARPSGVGSLGAAAGAGLALATAAAGAPVLLPAGIVCLALIALLLPRRASMAGGRARLLLVGLPPLVLFGPLIAHAATTPDGWRLLVSGPGAAVPTPEGDPWLAILGWPQTPPAIGLAQVSPWLALAASVTVVVAAVVALGRGGGLARAVRLGWLVVAVGALGAVLAPRVAVAVARTDGGETVVATGWAGPGASLVVLGLVMATLTAGGGLRAALHGRSFGWRQLGVAAISVVLVGGVVLAAIGWTTMLRGGALTVEPRTDDPVPAIGDELQASDSRSRVLAVWATTSGVVDGALWRSAGPQLTETSSAALLAQLDDVGTTDDAAAAALTQAVAALATGTATDTVATLSAHAVGVVVVPPVDSLVAPDGDETARDRLIGLLDSVRGLERVTENDSGVVWRVSTEEGASARVVTVDANGATVVVPSEVVDVGTEIGPLDGGGTLVLAERADAGWRATLDGAPLRSVPYGWQQAFAIPSGADGELTVSYRSPLGTPLLVLAAVVLAATALIAVPTRRRRLPEIEEAE